MAFKFPQPPWYQDFSYNQMKQLMLLDKAMQMDYEEMVTGRTRRSLAMIGITSTFFKLPSKDIRKLQHKCKFKAISFLQEIYKILTGSYFDNEEPRTEYNCNERLILSGIAFLTLAGAIVELHKRLPLTVLPKLPQKPTPPKLKQIKKRISPYEEEQFTRPDWSKYLFHLQEWHNECKSMPIPKVILPIAANVSLIDSQEQNLYANSIKSTQNCAYLEANVSKEGNISTKRLRGGSTQIKKTCSAQQIGELNDEYPSLTNSSLQNAIEDKEEIKGESTTFDLPELTDEEKTFKFIQPKAKFEPTEKLKSWLGEKDSRYVISNVSNNLPPSSVTYEVTGVANVTPCNSDERFFGQLNRKPGFKNVYTSGRENLSRKWQEWLQNVDEDFKIVEKQANKILQSVANIVKLVFPEPVCDGCCSCRQVRKAHLKSKKTKTPYVVIETLATQGDKKSIIFGSIAMHSPGPSPIESAEQIEIIPSENVITQSPIIQGLTKGVDGKTEHLLGDTLQHEVHVPSKTIHHKAFKTLRPIPHCECDIKKIFNKNDISQISTDDIPWTKEDGLCYGNKYRSEQFPAHSCKQYPSDKSCRRSPFKSNILKLKNKTQSSKAGKENAIPTQEKQLYSIADFKPCGDAHGMSLCDGPWGSLNIYSPEELLEQERLRLEILKAPPCGEKPGRAVCEGPWGTLIPREKHTVYNKTMEEGEFQEVIEEDEEDEETEVKNEENQALEIITERRERPKYRGEACFVSPQSLAARKKKIKALTTKKFVPDLSYPGYDDPWNILRTAPTEKNEGVTIYEKSLQLSSPQECSISGKTIKFLKNVKSKTSAKIETKVRYEANDKKFSTQNNSSLKRLRGGAQQDTTIIPVLKKRKVNKRMKKQHVTYHKSPTFAKKRKKRRSSHVHKDDEEADDDLKRKQKIAMLKNMMFSSETYPYHVDPVVIPEDPPRKCQPAKENMLGNVPSYTWEPEVNELHPKTGPCGWKTKSEQLLPVRKNLVYLTELDYPMEMIPVRPGGKPCKCRENRDKKKIQMHGIVGLTDHKKDAKEIRKFSTEENEKVELNRRILEGVFYYTPPPSPRRSDEYVPEYDLYKSPYVTCVSQCKDQGLRQLEMYLPPKSITSSKANNDRCECTINGIADYTKYNKNKPGFQKMKETLIDSKSPEEKWALALKDQGLITYFTDYQNNMPCWLKCSKYSKYGTSQKRLKLVKPVCECKYERKVLERKEEDVKWKERQQKLKGFKKKAYLNVDNIVRPNEMQKKLMITDIQRIPRSDEYIDDVKYCLSGVSESYVPAQPDTILAGISMTSPIVTPEPSKLSISVNKAHKHWSPMHIPPGPLPKKNKTTIQNAQYQGETAEDFAPSYIQKSKMKNPTSGNSRNANDSTKTTLRQRGGGHNNRSETHEISLQSNTNNTENEEYFGIEELRNILKIELQKMKKEGFLFAKLPKCYAMPQLQIWLLYRHGFVLTTKQKQKLMFRSIKEWNRLTVSNGPRPQLPQLVLSKKEVHNMTYKRIKEIKRKIQEKRAEFYSHLRQTRVMETRLWWPSMNFFEFGNATFKDAFFTYMANREADGHVFKPWMQNEILQKIK